MSTTSKYQLVVHYYLLLSDNWPREWDRNDRFLFRKKNEEKWKTIDINNGIARSFILWLWFVGGISLTALVCYVGYLVFWFRGSLPRARWGPSKHQLVRRIFLELERSIFLTPWKDHLWHNLEVIALVAQRGMKGSILFSLSLYVNIFSFMQWTLQ